METPIDPIRTVRVEVNFDNDRNRSRLAAIATAWFDEGWESLGGWLREALFAHPLPDLEVTEDQLQARIRRHFPEIGMPFMLLAAQTGDDGVQNWNRLYCDKAWHDFLELVCTVPAMTTMIMGGVVEPATQFRPAGTPGRPRFHSSMWCDASRSQTSLIVEADETFLVDDIGQQEALLAFLRSIADSGDPVYGECGVPSPRTVAPLMSTGFYVDAHLGRRTLRGFSWLTIVPKELLSKLEVAAIRDSGAFAEVTELAAGGLWLLATERFQDFDKDAARRVFNVLEPVLPVGLRDAYHTVEATFDWRHV